MCCQPHLTLVVALPVHIHWAKLICPLLLWDCFFLSSTCSWAWMAASPSLCGLSAVFLYNSRCLVVSALFPLSSVEFMVSSHHSDSSHSLDFQTKPQHISASSSSFYSPCLLWFGDPCLLIVSEKMNIAVFRILWGMSAKAAWRR